MANKQRNTLPVPTQGAKKPASSVARLTCVPIGTDVPEIQPRILALQQMSYDFHLPLSTLRQSHRLYRA